MQIRQTEMGRVAICRTCRIKRKLIKKNQIPIPQSYSNIPEEEIRTRSEREVKQNYQQMLDAGETIERKQRPGKQKRRKKKRTALKIILVLALLAVLGAGSYFGYRYYRDHIAGSGQNTQASGEDTDQPAENNSINVSTADFSVEYLKHVTGIDQSGNPCLLFYYIYTNNRKDITANALSDVLLTAEQNGSPCNEAVLAPLPEEAANMTVDIAYNKSINVCQVFTLSDSSDVTISVSDLLSTDDSLLGKQIFQL